MEVLKVWKSAFLLVLIALSVMACQAAGKATGVLGEDDLLKIAQSHKDYKEYMSMYPSGRLVEQTKLTPGVLKDKILSLKAGRDSIIAEQYESLDPSQTYYELVFNDGSGGRKFVMIINSKTKRVESDYLQHMIAVGGLDDREVKE